MGRSAEGQQRQARALDRAQCDDDDPVGRYRYVSLVGLNLDDAAAAHYQSGDVAIRYGHQALPDVVALRFRVCLPGGLHQERNRAELVGREEAGPFDATLDREWSLQLPKIGHGDRSPGRPAAWSRGGAGGRRHYRAKPNSDAQGISASGTASFTIPAPIPSNSCLRNASCNGP